MDKTEMSSPVKEFLKKDDKNVQLSKKLGIGLVLLIFSIFFSAIPDKKSLKFKSGIITKIYQVKIRDCLESKKYDNCSITLVNINNDKFVTQLIHPKDIELNIGEHLEVLSSYVEDKDAYRTFEVSLNGSLVRSYNSTLIKNNWMRIIVAAVGLLLIIYALTQREKI
jgi:hypothetical protein